MSRHQHVGPQVAIVAYGMGNLDSVARAVDLAGGRPIVTSDPATILSAGRIILPGVGAFAAGMAQLTARNLPAVLAEAVQARGIPLLGICLGMHLLADRGYEGGETAGLGWIRGEVRPVAEIAPDERTPHMGWNEVHPAQPSPLLAGIPAGGDFYFCHGYHLVCEHPDQILARTPFGQGVASAVGEGGVYGVQFHPEKSQRLGAQVLQNFMGTLPC